MYGAKAFADPLAALQDAVKATTVNGKEAKMLEIVVKVCQEKAARVETKDMLPTLREFTK